MNYLGSDILEESVSSAITGLKDADLISESRLYSMSMKTHKIFLRGFYYDSISNHKAINNILHDDIEFTEALCNNSYSQLSEAHKKRYNDQGMREYASKDFTCKNRYENIYLTIEPIKQSDIIKYNYLAKNHDDYAVFLNVVKCEYLPLDSFLNTLISRDTPAEFVKYLAYSENTGISFIQKNKSDYSVMSASNLGRITNYVGKPKFFQPTIKYTNFYTEKPEIYNLYKIAITHYARIVTAEYLIKSFDINMVATIKDLPNLEGYYSTARHLFASMESEIIKPHQVLLIDYFSGKSKTLQVKIPDNVKFRLNFKGVNYDLPLTDFLRLSLIANSQVAYNNMYKIEESIAWAKGKTDSGVAFPFPVFAPENSFMLLDKEKSKLEDKYLEHDVSQNLNLEWQNQNKNLYIEKDKPLEYIQLAQNEHEYYTPTFFKDHKVGLSKYDLANLDISVEKGKVPLIPLLIAGAGILFVIKGQIS